MCSVGSDANRSWFTNALDRLAVQRMASSSHLNGKLHDALMQNYVAQLGIIVEVEYQQRTADGKLRHPRLLRIRHDLMPSEVVK